MKIGAESIQSDKASCFEPKTIYRDLFESNPHPMWVYDLQTLCILDVNLAAANHYGYTKEEFLRLNLRDLRIAVDELVTGNELFGAGSCKHRKRNGEIIDVQLQGNIISFDGKNAELVSATDITVLLNSEMYNLDEKQNQILASERRFRALVQEGADLIGILDIEGNYKFVSDSSFPILGMHPSEFIGRNAFEFIHPDDREQIMIQFSRLSEVKQIKISPFRFKNAEGHWRWIRTTATNLLTDPAISGIVVSSRDITEVLLNRRALKQSNDRYKMIMKAANEAIYDWDILREKMVWGSGFRDIFGYRSGSPDRSEWFENIHHDDKLQVLVELKESVEDKNTDVAVSEFRFAKANGEEALVEHRIVFLRNRQGVAIRAVGSLKDITDYKQSLITIQLQNEKFKEIAWTQSHMARAPLASMMGLVDLIKNYPNSDIEKSAILDLFLKSADEFDQIIKQISGQTHGFQ